LRVENVSEPTGSRDGWLKSSYSGSTGANCVEVKISQESVFVRDSKDRGPDQSVIGVSPAAWSVFVSRLADSAE
jgi:hypothetical protein